MVLLATTNPDSPVKEVSGLEPSIAEASMAKGVGDASTTQVSASAAVVKLPLITRCWNAVPGVAVAILRVVLGITTWIWDCMSAPFRSELVVSEIDLLCRDTLLVLSDLLIEAKNSPPETASEVEMGHTQIRNVYNMLNPFVKRMIQAQILICIRVDHHFYRNDNKTLNLNEDGTVDIIEADQYYEIPRMIDAIAHGLPSSQLTLLEEELSNAITDETRVELLWKMMRITPSNLDLQITTDVLNTRVLLAFDGFRNSLKEDIYVQVRAAFRAHSPRDECHVEIGGIVVSIDHANFPVWALRSEPCDFRIMAALSEVKAGLNT